MQQTFLLNLINISDKKHETRGTFQRTFHPPKMKNKSGEYFYLKRKTFFFFLEKQRKRIQRIFHSKHFLLNNLLYFSREFTQKISRMFLPRNLSEKLFHKFEVNFSPPGMLNERGKKFQVDFSPKMIFLREKEENQKNFFTKRLSR